MSAMQVGFEPTTLTTIVVVHPPGQVGRSAGSSFFACFITYPTLWWRLPFRQYIALFQGRL